MLILSPQQTPMPAPYFGQDVFLGVDAEDEWVLAVGEVVREGGVLPPEVVARQVDVVEGLVVELGEVQQRRPAAVVGRV